MGRPRRKTTVLLAAGAALVLALALAPDASARFFGPEAPASPNAARLDTLWWIVFGLACVVFVGVEGALLYAVVRFRARKGNVAAQIHGNTTLEIGWTVGAAVILLILAIVTFAKLGGIRDPDNSDPNGYQAAQAVAGNGGGILYAQTEKRLPPNGRSLNICVNGQQYIWRFTYNARCSATVSPPPGAVFSYQTMVVPTHTTVTLDITAQDVAHSWWIPKLGGKFDAVPGYTNHTWFKIDHPGSYFGQCAELCGRNHANMVAEVQAVPPDQFEAYLADKKQQIAQADQAAAASRGRLEAGGQP